MTIYPFRYPTSILVRRHWPEGYDNYQSFKHWLRDEFEFRCAYCLAREVWFPNGATSFSVDHFDPKSVNSCRLLVYENLVYACTRCNSFKGVFTTLMDPSCCIYNDHISIDGNGVAIGISTDGKIFIDLFHLNDKDAISTRSEKILILQAYAYDPSNEALAKIYRRQFGYPEDLPDLSKLRPVINKNVGSENDSFYNRRKRNELNTLY